MQPATKAQPRKKKIPQEALDNIKANPDKYHELFNVWTHCGEDFGDMMLIDQRMKIKFNNTYKVFA